MTNIKSHDIDTPTYPGYDELKITFTAIDTASWGEGSVSLQGHSLRRHVKNANITFVSRKTVKNRAHKVLFTYYKKR